MVEGRLQIRDWTDKDGGKRRSAEVIADGIYFAGAKAAQPSEGNADEGTLPPRWPGSSRTWTTTASCRFERYDDLMLELPPGPGDHGMPLV